MILDIAGCHINIGNIYPYSEDFCKEYNDGEDSAVENALKELGKMPEDFKLYHNKKSWGGFVCFQSCL